jgi:two-component system alkaline phosphatase synthesis response regulator PhoP
MGDKMTKILVVDDEPPILDLLEFNLKKEGYEVIKAADGLAALEKVKEKPDLVILDLMLPGMDGLEVAKRVRNSSTVPLIMLTAKGEEIDRVLGLELGADDYITKPFSVRELLARIKAVLRRMEQVEKAEQIEQEQEIKAGDITLFPEKHEVFIKGKPKELTPKEFELLFCFLKHEGKVLSRDFLLEQVWDYPFAEDSRTVDVHIRYLRQKIEEDPSNPTYLKTVRGVGYKFKSSSAAQSE